MNILAHGLIFLLLVLCYSASCLTEIVKGINFTTIEVAGTPLRLKTFFSNGHYYYGIVGKYRGKSCYHVCGARGFVQASHFYDFSGFYRGYIELKHPTKPTCHKEYELNESYSFLEGNDDFCLCVRPNIQNLLYLVAGFPELHFPPGNRLVNESQFYDKALDPEDVYLTRSPCEGPSCSVRVDPYLAYTMNFRGNHTLVTPGKRTMVSELDRVLRDVKAMKADLENAQMTHEQIAKENDLTEKILSALKANQSALREEIAQEHMKQSNLSSQFQDLKMKNKQLTEIKLLNEELHRLKAVDEENAGLLQKIKSVESDLHFAQQQRSMLEKDQKARNSEMEQKNAHMHALKNENEKLKKEVDAKKQVVEDLKKTEVDYNVAQELLKALETRQEDLKSELKKALDEVEGLKVGKAQLQMTVDSTRPVFDQLENAMAQINKLEEKFRSLSEEKKTLEEEKRLLEQEASETQKERDDASTKLTFCTQQVDDLRKESEATVGELESLQRNQTEALRKEYKATVLRMEEEIRSVKDEIRDTQALASKWKEEKENADDVLEKIQTEMVQLRNENSKLEIHSKEKFQLLEETAKLQNVLKQTQEKVTSLEDTNAFLEKEKTLRQEQLEDVSEKYKALKSENENQSQELKELGEKRLIFQQLQSKFNGLEVERDILEEKLKLFKTQNSSLANENENLRTEIQTKNEELEKLDRAILEITKLQTELTTIKAEKHKVKEELTEAQQKLTKLEEKNEVFKRDVQSKDEMTKRLLTLEQETMRAHATLNELAFKKRQTEDALLAAREEVQGLGAQNSDMQKALKQKMGLEKELDSTKKIIDKVQGELAKIETEKSLSQTKLSSLEKEYKDLEKELELKSLAVVEFENKKSELDRVQEKLLELKEQKKIADEKWKQIQERLTQLEKENNQLQKKNAIRLEEFLTLNDKRSHSSGSQRDLSNKRINYADQPEFQNRHLNVKISVVPEDEKTVSQENESSPDYHDSEPTDNSDQFDSPNDHLHVKVTVVTPDEKTVSQEEDSALDDQHSEPKVFDGEKKPEDLMNKDDEPHLDEGNAFTRATSTVNTENKPENSLNATVSTVSQPDMDFQVSNANVYKEGEAAPDDSQIHSVNPKTKKHGTNQPKGKKYPYKLKLPIFKTKEKNPLSKASATSFDRTEPTETSHLMMSDAPQSIAEDEKEELSPGTQAMLGKETPGMENTEPLSDDEKVLKETLNLNDKDSSAQSQSMGYRRQPPCGARKNSTCKSENESQVHDPILHGPKTPNSCPFSDNACAQKSTPNVMSTAASYPEVPDDDDKTKQDDSPNSSSSISSRYANIFVFAAVLATLA